jgi:hypothetical protein
MAGEGTGALGNVAQAAQYIQQIISVFSGPSGCSHDVRNAVNHITVAANRNLHLAQTEIKELLAIGAGQVAEINKLLRIGAQQAHQIVQCTQHTVPQLRAEITHWRNAYGTLRAQYSREYEAWRSSQNEIKALRAQLASYKVGWSRERDIIIRDQDAIKADNRKLAIANSTVHVLQERLTKCETRPPSHASCCDCKDAIGQC